MSPKRNVGTAKNRKKCFFSLDFARLPAFALNSVIRIYVHTSERERERECEEEKRKERRVRRERER